MRFVQIAGRNFICGFAGISAVAGCEATSVAVVGDSSVARSDIYAPVEDAGANLGSSTAHAGNAGLDSGSLTAILSGPVAACDDGLAHPSVCCTGGYGRATSCVEGSDPFQPCEGGALTFPDPRSCCRLDGPTQCEPTRRTSGPGNQLACRFPCGPGASFPPAGGLDSCLDVPIVAVDGGFAQEDACRYCCFGVCATDVGECGPNGPCPQPTFGCGLCPSGWQNQQGIPDLCCRDGGRGRKCFSQAEWISAQPL
jgi:hypothetical protein